ncbi:hypothetical protein BC937DRAFT_86271 [Endogone sp. FLAS-F59071]|nr:hypothetical protein BC937DRAFT_86271 [Endogone sp. FLAS-F59071]|eukprot:RUS20149.1 hypothetical protein BC937DRAFT_86271 [Endogone sp. FLAS-F59071]
MCLPSTTSLPIRRSAPRRAIIARTTRALARHHSSAKTGLMTARMPRPNPFDVPSISNTTFSGSRHSPIPSSSDTRLFTSNLDHDMHNTCRTLFSRPIQPPRSSTYDLFSSNPFLDDLRDNENNLEIEPPHQSRLFDRRNCSPRKLVTADRSDIHRGYLGGFDRENVGPRGVTSGPRRGPASMLGHQQEAPPRAGPEICSVCKVYPVLVILHPCRHGLCQLCTQVKKQEAFKVINKITMNCPLCEKLVTEIIPYQTSEPLSGAIPRYNQLPGPRPQPSSIRPLSETSGYLVANFPNNFQGAPQYAAAAATSSSFMGDSVASQPTMVPPPPQVQKVPAPVAWPVIKLSNIPWDVSQNDIRMFLSHLQLPSASMVSQPIHIMMDRTSGKTLCDAYVEVCQPVDLSKVIESRHMKPLKGRLVSVVQSTQEELMRTIFPRWRGDFIGIDAVPPDSATLSGAGTIFGGGGGTTSPFVGRDEINSLLVVCRNYKLHFSRKCAERPFENIISVVTKYPWHQPQLITTLHRDHIYEMLKLAIESLRIHLSKDYVHIDSTLLQRLVRSGIMCSAFTERQKTMLLHTAQMDCPEDIIHFMLPPNCLVSNYYEVNGHELLSGNIQYSVNDGVAGAKLLERSMQQKSFDAHSGLRTPEPQENAVPTSSSLYPTPPHENQHSQNDEQSELQRKMDQFSGEIRHAQSQLKAAGSRLPLGNITNSPTAYGLTDKMERLSFAQLEQQKQADLAAKVQELLRSMSSNPAGTTTITGTFKEKPVEPSNASTARTMIPTAPNAPSKDKENLTDSERLTVSARNKKQMRANISRIW